MIGKYHPLIHLVIVIFFINIIFFTNVSSLNYSTNSSLSNVDASYIGHYYNNNIGTSISVAGDVNGDGIDDILIGATEEGSNDAGNVYLSFGKTNSWRMDYPISEADVHFEGENLGDNLGNSVRGVGDVNNDGFDDILMGASWNDDNSSKSGKTYLFFGKPIWNKNEKITNADVTFLGEKSNDFSGYSIGGKGDINNDGFNDILISAPYNDQGGALAGKTYLIFGNRNPWPKIMNLSNSDASFIGEHEGDLSGISSLITNDINGDGYDDILIGRTGPKGNFAGEIYLIFGKASGWGENISLSNSDASFIGENNSDRAGGAIVSTGDVNGDGYNDILIGARRNDEGGIDSGQTYLIFGKKDGWKLKINLSEADASFIGEQPYSNSGDSLAGAGDVNQDGYDDILIGASNWGENVWRLGKTYLLLGKKDGWIMDFNLSESEISFIGENERDSSGSSIDGGGDFNNDGFDDILISSIHNDEEYNEAGQIYVIFLNIGLSNNPPIIDIIQEQEVYVGNTFNFKVQGSDNDIWDFHNLTYSLESKPKGMTINSKSGMIKWIPKESDIGSHLITVNLSDGKDTIRRTFKIIVKEPKEQTYTDNITILSSIIIIILIVFIIIYRRQKNK